MFSKIVFNRKQKMLGSPLIIFAILIPQFNAIIGVIIGTIIGISMGGSILFGLLLESASYIAVPAVLRNALPQANQSLYITSALGITFPYNVITSLTILVSLSAIIHDSIFFRYFVIKFMGVII